MSKTAIISVDGHVRASRSDYRNYVEKRFLDAFDDWARAEEAAGAPESGNLSPGLDPTSQWDSDLRLKDMESQGVVAEVLFPNGLPFQSEAGGRRRHVLRPRARPSGAAGLQPLARRLLRADAGAPGGPGAHFVRRRREGRRRHPLGEGARPGRRHDARPASRRDLLLRSRARPGVGRLRRGRPADQPARGLGAPAYGPPGFAAIMTLALEHSFYSGRSLWQMILGGVFERFPDLRVAFVETEADWIAPAIRKLDRRLGLGRRLDRMGPDAAAHAPVHGLGPRVLGGQLLRRHLTLHRGPGPARGAGAAERRLRAVRHRVRQRHVRRRLSRTSNRSSPRRRSSTRRWCSIRASPRSSPQDPLRERRASCTASTWRSWRPTSSGSASRSTGQHVADRVTQAVAPGHLAQPTGRRLDRAREGLAVDGDEAERLGEAGVPFEVVEQRPVDVAAHVDPVVACTGPGLRARHGCRRSSPRRRRSPCRSPSRGRGPRRARRPAGPCGRAPRGTPPNRSAWWPPLRARELAVRSDARPGVGLHPDEVVVGRDGRPVGLARAAAPRATAPPRPPPAWRSTRARVHPALIRPEVALIGLHRQIDVRPPSARHRPPRSPSGSAPGRSLRRRPAPRPVPVAGPRSPAPMARTPVLRIIAMRFGSFSVQTHDRRSPRCSVDAGRVVGEAARGIRRAPAASPGHPARDGEMVVRHHRRDALVQAALHHASVVVQCGAASRSRARVRSVTTRGRTGRR